MGTAGGLFHLRDQILSDTPESVFVLHCDIVCPFPLKEMLAFHREKVRELGIAGTLLASRVSTLHPSVHRCLCSLSDVSPSRSILSTHITMAVS